MDGSTVRFCGRDRQVERLGSAVDRATIGTPGILLLSGETGIGKTRLVEEFLRRHRPPALVGACVPVAGGALPLAALCQALRMASALPEVAKELGVPGPLGRLVVPVVEADGSPDLRAAATSPLPLFQSVLGLLGRIGDAVPTAGPPAVLVVEDLQWADPSTLDLLSFLATNLTAEHVLVVLTYRDDVPLAAPLRAWLAELARLPSVERLPLPRLSPGETGEVVRHLLGRAPTPDELDRALRDSAGNPLFIEQLVLHGLDGAGGLPVTLKDLLSSRLDRLPPETRDVLAGAAVVGRPVEVRTLAAVVATDEDETEVRLLDAIRDQVVTVRGDTVSFRHPAFAEVAYSELLPAQRRRLHRAAAEQLTNPGAASEVARHWERAGDRERAMACSVTAGYEAEQVYAFGDAHLSLARAVTLAEQGHGAGLGIDPVELRVRAARAASLTGRHEEAIALLERALEDTASSGGRLRRAELHHQLGTIHFISGDGPATERELRTALALVADDETPLAAAVHAALAQHAAAWSQLDEAERFCASALRLADLTGAAQQRGVALNARGVLRAARGRLEEAATDIRAALAVAHRTQDADDLAAAYVNLSHVLALAGRLDEVAETCREGAHVLTRVGLVQQSGSLLLANGAEALLDAGRLDEAAELVERGSSLSPRGIMAAPVLLQAGRLATVRGDVAAARSHCEHARRVIEQGAAPVAWVRVVTEAVAEAELWAGRPDVALDESLAGLTALRDTDESDFGEVLLMLGLRALADLRDLSVDDAAARRVQASRAALLAAADVLGWDPLAPTAAGTAAGPSPRSAAAAATCRAELARVDKCTDPGRWQEARAAWSAVNCPVRSSYAGWREAEAALASRRTADGTAALRRTRAEATAMGMRLLVAELEALARWYRVDLAEDPAPAEPGALDGYNLTAREREILAELAAGRSNQEIADALFISVKTVSVHVTNILRKLDVRGRQEAARIAHRHGLGVAVGI